MQFILKSMYLSVFLRDVDQCFVYLSILFGKSSFCHLKGSVHVPNYKSFLVTEAERKHVRRRARYQQHGDAKFHQVSFVEGKAQKKIHAILTETLGNHALSYATVKNWVAQFKRRDFSTCDAPRPGRPKQLTTAEIIDQIHELILEDRRISAKPLAEQLGISRERVESIIDEDLDKRKLSAKWVFKYLNADQKRH